MSFKIDNSLYQNSVIQWTEHYYVPGHDSNRSQVLLSDSFLDILKREYQFHDGQSIKIFRRRNHEFN
jgi:hypothetical protein